MKNSTASNHDVSIVSGDRDELDDLFTDIRLTSTPLLKRTTLGGATEQRPKKNDIILRKNNDFINWLSASYRMTLSPDEIVNLPDYAFLGDRALAMFDVKGSLKYRDCCSVSDKEFAIYNRLSECHIQVWIIFFGSDNVFRLGLFDRRMCSKFNANAFYFHSVRHFERYARYDNLVERVATIVFEPKSQF